MNIKPKYRTSVNSQNCSNLANNGSTQQNSSLNRFCALKRNSTQQQPPRPSSKNNARISLNSSYRLTMQQKVSQKSHQKQIKAQKNLKQPPQMNPHKFSGKQNKKKPNKGCMNHPYKNGNFSIQCMQQEQLIYCSTCAINLLVQQFPIKSVYEYQNSFNPQQRLLSQLFQYHGNANSILQQLYEESGMKVIQKSTEQIQEKYERLFLALQQMKRQQLMKLDIQKLQVFDQLSNYEGKINGIKKKISYIVAQLAPKFQSNHSNQNIYDFYNPVLKNIKNQLSNFNIIKITKPMNKQTPSKSDNNDYKSVCNRLSKYFSQRVFQLSFQEELKGQPQEKDLKESLHESKIIFANQQSNEIISFDL